jgi:hypothetical protein
MRRLLMTCTLVGLAASAGGCLALMPVGSHIERGRDFAGYRTYDWAPADARPATDPRLRDNPFFIDEVHGAIDTELNKRGLARATAERADLLVHYHASVNERLEVTTRPGRFRDCVGDDCRAEVTTYEAGTLVVDLIDASTHRLVWRGWAEHRLEDMLDEPAQVRQRVQVGIRRIFTTLPLTVVAAPGRTGQEDVR